MFKELTSVLSDVFLICILCNAVKLHKQKMAIVHHQVPYSYKELPFRIEKKWFEKKNETAAFKEESKIFHENTSDEVLHRNECFLLFLNRS